MDLRAQYGITADQLIDGSISARELARLIEWLPDTSAMAASMMGGSQWRGWGIDRMINRGVHLHTAAAVAKRKPQPVPLPSRAKSTRTRLAGLPGAVRRGDSNG